MQQRLKVYVAASSKELDRAKKAMALVQSYGHHITHDWVRCVEEEGEANPASATHSQRVNWAEDDLEGVANADLLWLLVPENGGFGAAVELGYALCLREPMRRIIASGAHERSIFTALSDACYAVDDHAAVEFRFGV